MKREQFREGDPVEVVTVDRANGEASTNRAKLGHRERWRAVVIGPSVMGPGWWVVKKLHGSGRRWATYTVPDIEMVRVRR